MNDDELRDLLPTLIGDAVREALRGRADTRWRLGTCQSIVSLTEVQVLIDGDALPTSCWPVVGMDVADRVLVVFTEQGGAWAFGGSGIGGGGGSFCDDCLPLEPTDLGPGEPCDWGVYTHIGWSCPPSPTHVWTGSGWLELTGAAFGQAIAVFDSFAPHTFAASDAVATGLDLGPGADTPVSDTFTATTFAATDAVVVTLT